MSNEVLDYFKNRLRDTEERLKELDMDYKLHTAKYKLTRATLEFNIQKLKGEIENG